MIALLDSYELDRDHNHERKVKMRADLRNLFANTKPCDRCEGYGTLIDLFSETNCTRCNELGRIKRLTVIK